MALFGDIQIEGNTDLQYMSEDANFGNFYSSMLLLFRMATGESWNGVMTDCYSGARCKETGTRECGGTAAALILFISFFVLVAFVFLNLFIAVMIDKLFENELNRDDEDQLLITPKQFEQFVAEWSRIAPDGSAYAPTAKLPALLKNLDPPLGFRDETLVGGGMLHLLMALGFWDFGGCVHFAEVLWRLVAMVSGADMRNAVNFEVHKVLAESVARVLPVPPRASLRTGKVLWTTAEYLAATAVQSVWRGHARRRRLRYQLSVSDLGMGLLDDMIVRRQSLQVDSEYPSRSGSKSRRRQFLEAVAEASELEMNESLHQVSPKLVKVALPGGDAGPPPQQGMLLKHSAEEFAVSI